MIKQNIRIASILLAILLIVIGIGIGIAKADTRAAHNQLHELQTASLHQLGEAHQSLLLDSSLEALSTHDLSATLAGKVLKSEGLLNTLENAKVLNQSYAKLDLLKLSV
jgi:hypothetical protein